MRCVRALLHDRAGLACLLFLGIVLLAALLAPWLTPWDPLAVDGSRKLAPCGPEHGLGTDRLGRDILSRLLYGARATLGVSLLAMGATVSLGALLGMLASLVRGRVESCLMRLCDVMLSFPGEVMVLAIVGMLGPGLENVVLACVVAKWPWYARMMRTITSRASPSIMPHSGVGGCTPSPRKDRAETISITAPVSSVARTLISPAAQGSR